jgi:c-di-GMP-binding flagellar brake protein YcgR
MVIPVNHNNEGVQHLRSDRRNSRVKVQIPCEVGPPGGEMNVALMRDLSCGGVKFSCNQHVINNFFPEDEAPLGVVLDVFINIHFNLSEDQSSEALIKTSARVIHTERLAQDLFQVGVEFIDLAQAATKSLQDYIGGSQIE